MFIARRIALFAIFSSAGYAQTPGTVNLNDLIRDALARNPEILAAQHKYQAARLRPQQQSSLPDPVVSLGYASNGNPLPGAGLGSNPTSNIGIMVSQEMPYPGKRRLRGEIASKEADSDFDQYQLVRLNVRSRVIQAYHRLHHTYAGVDVLTEGKDLLTRFIRVAEERYATGKATQQDVFKAQTQLSLLEARLIEMQQDRSSAESELNMLLNRDPGTPIGEPMEDDPKEIPVTLAQLFQEGKSQSPALRREQSRIESNQLALTLANKDLHPDYTLSGGYFNQGTMPAMYQFRIDVQLPFYAKRKQRPAIAQQAEMVSEAQHGLAAADRNLQFRIKDTYQLAQTAFRLIQLYKDTVLPQADLTVESSLTAYETGAGDFTAVLNNLLMKVDSEERYHEQMMSYSISLASLEELTGVSLDGEVIQ
jgi:outer membrane protein TolC